MRKMTEELFYKIKGVIDVIKGSNPEGIKCAVALETLNNMLPKEERISEATFHTVTRSDNFDQYMAIRKQYDANKKAKRIKKNEINKDLIPDADTLDTELHPMSEQDQNSDHVVAGESQTENNESCNEVVSCLVPLFEKYFMIPTSGQYEEKTISQQVTCAVIALNALRNELHKDYVNSSKEATFGKRIIDLLTVVTDDLPVIVNNQACIANNQAAIIRLLERLVALWESPVENCVDI